MLHGQKVHEAVVHNGQDRLYHVNFLKKLARSTIDC